MLRQARVNVVRMADVALLPFGAQFIEAPMGTSRQHTNAIASGRELLSEIEPEEACAAGDERVHGWPCSALAAQRESRSRLILELWRTSTGSER